MGGRPKFGPSQDFLNLPFARSAELLSRRALRVELPGSMRHRGRDAGRRPVVLEADVDAGVPPPVPELRPKQREHLEKAPNAGDADAMGVRERLAL